MDNNVFMLVSGRLQVGTHSVGILCKGTIILWAHLSFQWYYKVALQPTPV